MSNRYDPRAILATIAVLGAFTLQGYLSYKGPDNVMPPWVVGLVSSIVAFYFGQRSADGHNNNSNNHDGGT